MPIENNGWEICLPSFLPQTQGVPVMQGEEYQAQKPGLQAEAGVM
jgi:hypothetical protein